jgi:hypothetical protein
LDKALKIVQDQSMSDSEFRKELMNKTLKKLFIDDDLFAPLEELDDIYYDIEDEDISDLLGKHLKKIF